MRIPAPLGLTPMGSDSLIVKMQRAMRRLQGRGGYADTEESLRYRELLALATAAGIGSNTISRAGAQAFVHRATELLEEWERAYRLPNDAARTVLERQQRLMAQERISGGGMKGNIEGLLQAFLNDGVATLLGAGVDAVGFEGAEEETAFNQVVFVSAATLDDPEQRRMANTVLDRIMPAKGRRQHTLHDADLLVDSIDCEWASTLNRFDRTAILADTAGSRGSSRTPARHVSYGPRTKLRAGDLNTIQERVCWGNAESPSNHSHGGTGGISMVGSIEAPVGTTDFDETHDYRDRMIWAMAAHSNLDIRPGEASDFAYTSATQVPMFFIGGSGGASFDAPFPSDSLSWRVDATDGRLQIVNAGGATRYVTAILFASADQGHY